jgi:L-galactose dehydrogenase
MSWFCVPLISASISSTHSEEYDESEAILGKSLRGVPRDSYVVATKWRWDWTGELSEEPDELRRAVEKSLSRLQTDYVDVMMFHGLMPAVYDAVVDRFVPVLQRLKEQGRIRHIGFSTRYPVDTSQQAAVIALESHPKLWDVIELKYGILNQLAADKALPLAIEHNVGIVNMAAVRERLPDPALLEQTVAEWKATGHLGESDLPKKNPLGWLIHDDVDSVVSAGYKFAADHAAISAVLTGTATIAHLEANANAIENPRLGDADKGRLVELFGDIDQYV